MGVLELSGIPIEYPSQELSGETWTGDMGLWIISTGMIFEAGKVDEKYPRVCRVRRVLRFSHEECRREKETAEETWKTTEVLK